MRLYRILCVMVFAVILASCNSSKKVLYMQDVAVDVPEEIANMHEIKVQPGDKITIVVSCMDGVFKQIIPDKALLDEPGYLRACQTGHMYASEHRKHYIAILVHAVGRKIIVV